MTSMFEPNAGVEALEQARDEIDRLFCVGDLISKPHTMAILRRYLDALTPEPPS